MVLASSSIPFVAAPAVDIVGHCDTVDIDKDTLQGLFA